MKGFSLIELMIVIAIIGILSAIAIPAYGDYTKRSKIQAAVANLSDSRTKMEQYFQDNRTYQTVPAAGTACGWPMPAVAISRYFTLTCVAQTANTYTITATGVATEAMTGFVYTVDQSNGRTSTFTTTNTTGYINSTTCWVSKKAESC